MYNVYLKRRTRNRSEYAEYAVGSFNFRVTVNYGILFTHGV